MNPHTSSFPLPPVVPRYQHERVPPPCFNFGNDSSHQPGISGALDRMATLFWVTDLRARLMELNRAAAAHFGLSPKTEVTGHRIKLEFHSFDDESGEETGELLISMEAADGSEGWFLLDRQPVFEDGAQIGWAWFARNVSRLNQSGRRMSGLALQAS